MATYRFISKKDYDAQLASGKYGFDSAPTWLITLDEYVCSVLGDEVDAVRYNPVFNTITQTGWFSLANCGGFFIEHFHWATYIEPRMDEEISHEKEAGNYEGLRRAIIQKHLAKELLLDNYIFYGTG